MMNYDGANTILAICGIIGSVITVTTLLGKRASRDSNVKDRVVNLEKVQGDMAKDIKDIKENHLSHIQADISGINTNLASINTTLEFLKQK